MTARIHKTGPLGLLIAVLVVLFAGVFHPPVTPEAKVADPLTVTGTILVDRIEVESFINEAGETVPVRGGEVVPPRLVGAPRFVLVGE